MTKEEISALKSYAIDNAERALNELKLGKFAYAGLLNAVHSGIDAEVAEWAMGTAESIPEEDRHNENLLHKEVEKSELMAYQYDVVARVAKPSLRRPGSSVSLSDAEIAKGVLLDGLHYALDCRHAPSREDAS